MNHINNNVVNPIQKNETEFGFPIPKDQVFFLSSQIISLFFAILFRYLLESFFQSKYVQSNSQKTLIYLLTIIPGIFFAYLCFGNQIFHLIILTFISYILISTLDPEWIHIITFVVAMLYLSMVHLHRLFNHFQTYQLDITAPMMILVQKVTSLAFSLHDGSISRKQQLEQLNLEQKQKSIKIRPSFLSYCSYCLNFQTILCGPFLSYVDFNDYINGDRLKRYELQTFPSVSKLILLHLFQVGIIALLILKFVPLYPIEYLFQDEFYQMTLLHKFWTIYWITTAARLKYYFAWKLAECICNASGLGFNGFEPTRYHQPKYDLATNISIFDFEMSLSLRDAISQWNISTNKWLRIIAYDRAAPNYKILATYSLSAMWHGFFPGYYLTMATGGLFTVAARTARRLLRYRFMNNNDSNGSLVEAKIFYHFITWLLTRLSIAYMTFPFVMLEFCASIKVYRSMYFCGHLLALFICIFLPNILEPAQPVSSATTNGTKSKPNIVELKESHLPHQNNSNANEYVTAKVHNN